MNDIKMVNWPKRPAEQRRDELEIENAELRKLVEQMESVFRSMLEKPQCEVWRFESEINAVLEAAERGGE